MNSRDISQSIQKRRDSDDHSMLGTKSLTSITISQHGLRLKP